MATHLEDDERPPRVCMSRDPSCAPTPRMSQLFVPAGLAPLRVEPFLHSAHASAAGAAGWFISPGDGNRHRWGGAQLGVLSR